MSAELEKWRGQLAVVEEALAGKDKDDPEYERFAAARAEVKDIISLLEETVGMIIDD
jgi:hypothetical protein